MTEMKLYDIRVTVKRIEGRSVCGLQVGDYFEVTESSRVRIPEGRHFCLYALQSVLPLIPAKQRRLPAADGLGQESVGRGAPPLVRVVPPVRAAAQPGEAAPSAGGGLARAGFACLLPGSRGAGGDA